MSWNLIGNTQGLQGPEDPTYSTNILINSITTYSVAANWVIDSVASSINLLTKRFIVQINYHVTTSTLVSNSSNFNLCRLTFPTVNGTALSQNGLAMGSSAGSSTTTGYTNYSAWAYANNGYVTLSTLSSMGGGSASFTTGTKYGLTISGFIN
jgi:hypothetical protein